MALALLHAYFNGFNNSGTIVAAPIATGSLQPRLAIPLAVVGEFIGPFIFGIAVATTIGNDFLNVAAININVLLATVIAVIIWNVTTWYFGIPSSSSHALAGGLMGSAFVAAGIGVFKWAGVVKIFAGLVLAPIAGILGGYLLLKLVLYLARPATPRVNVIFRYAHTITTTLLAMSHGTNNGQQTMGLITLGLLTTGVQSQFAVPTAEIFAVALALALGVGTGGYRIIRKVGAHIYRIRPVHGFASQGSSAGIILTSSLIGSPVSSTQVISSSIMGVGAAQRARGVRWEVAGQIMAAWLITIPIVAGGAALIYLLLELLSKV